MRSESSANLAKVRAKFVSDIHIYSADDPRLGKFESVLRSSLTDGTTHLFLVGDIFDLWVGSHSFFRERYGGVVELIRQLRQKNVEINYFEGNHDLHIQKLWSDELKCQVFVEPAYFNLAGLRVRVEHGDQMNPSDKGYLFLRAVLRTGFVKWLAEALPGSVIQSIGDKMSRSSRRWTSSPLKALDEAGIKEMIHNHARRVRKNDKPFDLLISGHVHVRDDFTWRDEISGQDVRTVNLGWWAPTVGAPFSIFCIDAEGRRWVDIS